MKYIYTATFKTDSNKVYARVPDLPGCVTTGKDLSEAIEMIADAAALWLITAEDNGDTIPQPSTQGELRTDDDLEYSIICIDTIQYRAETDTRAVRKNVSLPAWMVSLADKHNINCSQLLQDAILKKLDVA